MKRYFIRYIDTFIGIMWHKDDGTYDVQLVKPQMLHTPRRKRSFMTDEEVRYWLSERATERANPDFVPRCLRFGVNPNDAEARMKLALATYGLNVRDYIWFSENEDDTFKDIDPARAEYLEVTYGI